MCQYSIEIPGKLESLRIAAPFTDAVLNEIPDIAGRGQMVHDLALVTSEALTNALRHAGNPGSRVRLAFTFYPDRIVITITDQGPGFDPGVVPLPDFENCPEGGYGIFIINTVMDGVRYEKNTEGNDLILIKTWKVL